MGAVKLWMDFKACVKVDGLVQVEPLGKRSQCKKSRQRGGWVRNGNAGGRGKRTNAWTQQGSAGQEEYGYTLVQSWAREEEKIIFSQSDTLEKRSALTACARTRTIFAIVFTSIAHLLVLECRCNSSHVG